MNNNNLHQWAELNPTQKKILTCLMDSGKPLKQSELIASVKVSQSAVSKNLKVLREKRYISFRNSTYRAINKEDELQALTGRIAQAPSEVFSVSANTLAVKIQPRLYMIYETDFKNCFFNINCKNSNELFGIVCCGDVLYIHLRDENSVLLKENIQIIKKFFS